MKVKVIPLVIDAIGTTPIKLRNCLKEIGIETQIDLQETVFLHTTQILQKVLKVQGSLLLLDLENINPLLKQCVK